MSQMTITDLGGRPISHQKIGPHDYFYLDLASGQVQIKLDDEGVVVDILDERRNEVVATTCCLYEDMKAIQEDEFECAGCDKICNIGDDSVTIISQDDESDRYCLTCALKILTNKETKIIEVKEIEK